MHKTGISVTLYSNPSPYKLANSTSAVAVCENFSATRGVDDCSKKRRRHRFQRSNKKQRDSLGISVFCQHVWYNNTGVPFKSVRRGCILLPNWWIRGVSHICSGCSRAQRASAGCWHARDRDRRFLCIQSGQMRCAPSIPMDHKAYSSLSVPVRASLPAAS